MSNAAATPQARPLEQARRGTAATASAAAPGMTLHWGLFLAVAVLLGVLAIPQPEGLTIAGQRMLAILAFAIVVWITEAVSYEASAIMITSLMAGLIGFAPTVNDPGVQYGTDGARLRSRAISRRVRSGQPRARPTPSTSIRRSGATWSSWRRR